MKSKVAADDLVLVKVRYKQPGASEEDAASEVARSLATEAVESEPGALDADFRWALAIAAFAEIAKKSPYANPARLDAITELVHESVHESHADRVEFVGLFDSARSLGIGER